MFELKRLSEEAIPAALEKALRYRLLNEPAEAESICHDVLRIDPENHFAPVTGTRDWTRHEVTAQVPADAISIIFGVFLDGVKKFRAHVIESSSVISKKPKAGKP